MGSNAKRKYEPRKKALTPSVSTRNIFWQVAYSSLSTALSERLEKATLESDLGCDKVGPTLSLWMKY